MKQIRKFVRMYNATSIESPEGSNRLETYQAWLERQLQSRIEKIRLLEELGERLTTQIYKPTGRDEYHYNLKRIQELRSEIATLTEQINAGAETIIIPFLGITDDDIKKAAPYVGKSYNEHWVAGAIAMRDGQINAEPKPVSNSPVLDKILSEITPEDEARVLKEMESEPVRNPDEFTCKNCGGHNKVFRKASGKYSCGDCAFIVKEQSDPDELRSAEDTGKYELEKGDEYVEFWKELFDDLYMTDHHIAEVSIAFARGMMAGKQEALQSNTPSGITDEDIEAWADSPEFRNQYHGDDGLTSYELVERIIGRQEGAKAMRDKQIKQITK